MPHLYRKVVTCLEDSQETPCHFDFQLVVAHRLQPDSRVRQSRPITLTTFRSRSWCLSLDGNQVYHGVSWRLWARVESRRTTQEGRAPGRLAHPSWRAKEEPLVVRELNISAIYYNE